MKYFVSIDRERCKGCGLCIHYCPQKCLTKDNKFNSKGYYPAIFVGKNKCIGCGFCYITCPDYCIEIYEKNGKRRVRKTNQ